jgi:hypothetical protein
MLGFTIGILYQLFQVCMQWRYKLPRVVYQIGMPQCLFNTARRLFNEAKSLENQDEQI